MDCKPFTLTHQSVPLKLDDQLLQAIVAIDDRNRRRFQIGSHAVGGRKELVIRLTPLAPRSAIGATPPQSSTTYISPPTLRPTSPYAVYFCVPHMIKVLTTAGINFFFARCCLGKIPGGAPSNFTPSAHSLLRISILSSAPPASEVNVRPS